MSISNRLKTIANMVTRGYSAADIGTDHGYVPVYLLREQISPFVIAADLSPGSLEKAREHAARAGLEGQMDCRLSDGFAAISPGEVQTAILSGMGGTLMVRILEEGGQVVSTLKELILSPHRDADLVRTFLSEHGFVIVEETELIDKKKHYVIIKAHREPAAG